MNGKRKIALLSGLLLTGSMLASAEFPGLTAILDKLFSIIAAIFNKFIEAQLGRVIFFLTWNPDVGIVKPLIDDFIRMLTPLYIIAFISVGIYFFFLSESPRGRATARSALLKLLLSIAFVISATTIFQFLIDFSELLVNFVLDFVVVDVSGLGILLMAGMIGTAWPLFAFAYFFFLLTLLIVYSIRYLLLLIMAAIFPLTIFFFYFEFTKGIGRKLMHYTFTLLFTPVIQAVMLLFWVTTMNNIGTSSGAAGDFAIFAIGVAGFVLMMTAPWVTLKLLKWVGGIIAFAGFRFMGSNNMLGAMACFFTGGLMMGEGPGAIPLAATFWFVGQLEHKSEHISESRMYREKGKAKPQIRKSRGRRRSGGGGTPPEPPEGRRVWRRGPPSGEGPKTAPGWVNATGMSRQESIRAGDELASVGRDAASKGYKQEAILNLEKAAEKYRDAVGRHRSAVSHGPSLSNSEKADVFSRLGDVYRELNRLNPSNVHSQAALRSYSDAVENYGWAMRRRGVSSAEISEYTLKSNECRSRSAEIRYKRG